MPIAHRIAAFLPLVLAGLVVAAPAGEPASAPAGPPSLLEQPARGV